MPPFKEHRTEAAEEFNRRLGRSDGPSLLGSLCDGLDVVRDTLYQRLHHDVEYELGQDSLIMPVSEVKTELTTKKEIDLFQSAEAAAAVVAYGYLDGDADADWLADWLARARLDPADKDAQADKRLRQYQGQDAERRRLTFTDVLARVLPESTRAPLVLFHLIPLSVDIAVAQAFGDQRRSQELRKRQVTHLAAIRDCDVCQGNLFENGERCRECGNPVWKYKWLQASE